ncbi:unnamed protein product [Gongylonema pulchrum]|uniref:VPS13 domain-containing protein n=1 Tax=Gongylonema pulchrum TaxID=637853 RepID=A0A183DZH8_9BILA|nr:unnamed protein product [Gongylonema pulchrum]
MDIATRRTTLEKLQSNRLWWNGPELINREQNEWPKWNTVLSIEIIERNKEIDVEDNKAFQARIRKQLPMAINDDGPISSRTRSHKVAAIKQQIHKPESSIRLDGTLTGVFKAVVR